jgi:hypothetical protein
MSDVLRIETINAVQAEQRRRYALRKASCKTCREWADVIHGDYNGRREERWHDWPEPEHRCPQCGREPEVLVVHFAFDFDDPEHPTGCTCPECTRVKRNTELLRGPASQEPRSRPSSPRARVPVAPESAQTADPPTEEKRSSEVTGREWESQKSRRRGALTRGVTDAKF